MSTENSILLTQDEIRALTGLQQPASQVERLHAMGYWLARRTPLGVALPRAHYLAVCAGAVQQTQTPAHAQAARPRVRTMAERGTA